VRKFLEYRSVNILRFFISGEKMFLSSLSISKSIQLLRYATVGCFLVLGIFQKTIAEEAIAAREGDVRQHLPVADVRHPTVHEVDPSKVSMPKDDRISAPTGSPNVVVILLDDLGFGGPESFGGPIAMPTLDHLASNGLRFNRFHTVALCAPTRAALRHGRNHHVLNMGSIPEIATGFPGNTCRLPNDTASLAEILRLNGYNTAAFGKWHSTLGRETTVSGPQDTWPTRQGFEKFYGFIGAEENMYEPTLHDGVTNIDFPDHEGYHLADDMTRESIEWLKQQHSMTPEKPFFIYYSAPGVHAPHQVPSEWCEKYRGKFDAGWDVLREETLARQIEMGVAPAGTKLAKTADSIPAWDSLEENQKKIFARQAEVFAAFAEYTDHQVGRLLSAIDDLGKTDNTLVIYISGDNGTSAEGNYTGNWNWGNMLNGRQETVEEQLSHFDEWGGRATYPHMSVGWAIAFDTPFAFTKQVAGDFGGTRNGTVIHWPAGIKAKGEMRSQFSHVIDIAPTVLEATGITEPTVVNGVPQVPMQGTSLMYAFDNRDAKEKHSVQYFEIIGNRAIYNNGWLARATVKLPWENKKLNEIKDDTGWQLFNTQEDFSLAHDLSSQYPDRLAAMKEQFVQEAVENGAFPLDDRLLERLLPEVAGRPTLMGDRTSLTLYPGAININENALLSIKNCSSRVTAEVEITEEANGVIFAQGGRFGGWAILVEDGRASYVYNDLGDRIVVKSSQPLQPGSNTIVVDFQYDGDEKGAGGDVNLIVNEESPVSARINRTIPSQYSIDEGADVACDRGSPVIGHQLGPYRNSRFTGEVKKVTLEINPQR
tara:strand:+ start:901 stop:3369 length:2469 start_codon:yes stop_codon:yes gene_type:complete